MLVDDSRRSAGLDKTPTSLVSQPGDSKRKAKSTKGGVSKKGKRLGFPWDGFFVSPNVRF